MSLSNRIKDYLRPQARDKAPNIVKKMTRSTNQPRASRTNQHRREDLIKKKFLYAEENERIVKKKYKQKDLTNVKKCPKKVQKVKNVSTCRVEKKRKKRKKVEQCVKMNDDDFKKRVTGENKSQKGSQKGSQSNKFDIEIIQLLLKDIKGLEEEKSSLRIKIHELEMENKQLKERLEKPTLNPKICEQKSNIKIITLKRHEKLLELNGIAELLPLNSIVDFITNTVKRYIMSKIPSFSNEKKCIHVEKETIIEFPFCSKLLSDISRKLLESVNGKQIFPKSVDSQLIVRPGEEAEWLDETLYSLTPRQLSELCKIPLGKFHLSLPKMVRR
eukprot:g3707.t1